MNTVNNTTQTSSAGMVVACLGESLTKGEVSYDWISELQSRPQNAAIRFVNLGVGGITPTTHSNDCPR